MIDKKNFKQRKLSNTFNCDNDIISSDSSDSFNEDIADNSDVSSDFSTDEACKNSLTTSDTEDYENHIESQNYILILATCAIIICSFFIYLTFCMPTTSSNTISLKNAFPNQKNISVKILAIALKHFLTGNYSELKKPAVLTFAVNNSMESFENLKQNLSRVLKFHNLIKSDSCPKFPCSHCSNESINEELHLFINTAINNNDFCVDIGVLNTLPSVISTYLQGLFDHENAPFKKMIYLLTIQAEPGSLKSVSTLSNLAYNEKIIFKRITDLWAADIDSARTESLAARIQNIFVVE